MRKVYLTQQEILKSMEESDNILCHLTYESTMKLEKNE